MVKKILICLAVSTEYRHVSDRRTDRQTDRQTASEIIVRQTAVKRLELSSRTFQNRRLMALESCGSTCNGVLGEVCCSLILRVASLESTGFNENLVEIKIKDTILAYALTVAVTVAFIGHYSLGGSTALYVTTALSVTAVMSSPPFVIINSFRYHLL